MPLRPGRAIIVPLAAGLLAGAAQAAQPGPGPAPVPLVPVTSQQEPVPPGPGPDEALEEPKLPETLTPGEIAAGVPVRVPPEPHHQTWLDTGHTLVGNLLGTVLEIDRFFSDERELDIQRERSFLRWRNDFRITSNDPTVSYRTTVLADLKFPGVNRWLERARLVIAGESEDTAEAIREGTTGSAAAIPTPAGAVGRAAAELQYALFETFHVKTDIGGGIIFRLPPGAVARLRLRYAQPLGASFLLRLAAMTFIRTDLGVGELLQGEVEQRLAADTVVRLTTGALANHRQRDRGVQWASELAYIQAIGPRSAFSVGAGLDGVTLPAYRVNAYRLFTRVRHDVFRRWIFFEAEPEVFWPFVPAEPRSPVYGFTFRVEAQFQGSGRREQVPAAAPPPDVEPKDPD